jgi:acyl-CoA dehydrogenase
MDVSYSNDELAFRQQVRAFIRDNLDPAAIRGQRLSAASATDRAVFESWHAALYRQGWVAPYWPREFGGPGWTPAQRYIFETECAMAGAPRLLPFGIQMVGPVLMKYGAQAQKDFYLPRILSGEDHWCQGYSEPGAGSDLASLSTRADRDGDHYIVNGSKIWTTHAHFADRMFALVRTSSPAKRQDGISFLLVDMKLSGISLRPIITMGGDHECNQVFFDDVRVPVGDLVGEENKGWEYAKYLLEFERGAGFRAARLRRQLDDVGDLLRTTDARAVDFKDTYLKLSRIAIDIDALEYIELRLLETIQRGQNPGPVSSILKLRGSEIYQAITELGVEIIGYKALIWEPRRPLYDLQEPAILPDEELAVLPIYLDGRAHTIFGGAAEIQHEIISKRMLGL